MRFFGGRESSDRASARSHRLTPCLRAGLIVRMTLAQKTQHPGLGIRSALLKWLSDGRKLAFCATDRPAAIAWQKKARAALQKSLGPELPRVPLKPRVLEVVDLDGYTRTLLTLDTAPHVKALAWLCVPHDIPKGERRPAMIATPGHGHGAKDLLAMDHLGQPREEGKGYQKDYGLAAVRLGYPVLVVEPLGFGDRRDLDHRFGKEGKPVSESGCQAAFTLATMLGSSLARLRVNDLQRGLDFFQTVPQVDPKRIGLMGISGGGQMTLWTTAIEPRFKAAIVSGYINEFRHSVLGMHHCICNFVPGLAQHLDMADLAALVAPRPLLIQSGTKDDIFPIKATKSAIKEIRAAYGVFGVKENVEVDIFEGDHQWSPTKVAAFLSRSL